MKIISVLFLLLLVFLFGLNLFTYSSGAKTKKKEVFSSFCQAEVPSVLSESNTSFYEIYTFRLDSKGIPKNVKKIKGRLTGNQSSSCLKNWKFSGFKEGSLIRVYFYWMHGKGWTRMSIRSEDFSQTTLLNDKTCPI